MGFFMINYKDEVKRLISNMYEPADLASKEFEMTTFKITRNLQNILPGTAIDEHMVYEALRELNFEPQEIQPLEFFWYFRRKL